MKEKLQPIWKKAQVVWKNYGYYISLVCLLSLFGLAAWLYRTGNHDADAVYAASAAQPVLAQETAAVSPPPRRSRAQLAKAGAGGTDGGIFPG